MSQAIIESLILTFPNGNKFASSLVNMDSVNLTMSDEGGGIFVELKAEMNVDALRRLYPSMANLLNHLANMEISVIEKHKEGSNPASDVSSARCFFSIHIVHKGGGIHLTITNCIEKRKKDDKKEGRLLWFDRTTKKPCLDKGNNVMPVDFKENEPGYATCYRISIDGTFRIPQLGCGSIGKKKKERKKE